MSLRSRLEGLKKKLGSIALREPRTNQERKDRWNWNRVTHILFKRYESKEIKPDLEDDPDYRYHDFRDEIIQVEKMRKKI